MVVEQAEEIRVKLYVPTPHSPEQASFVRCVAKRQIIKAGRQFGKTVGAAMKAIEAFWGICPACGGEKCAYCDYTGEVRPKRVLYAAPVLEQVGKFWYEVCEALREPIDAGILKKDETEHTITMVGTDVCLKAKTAWNADSLRGGNWDLLILEEFQLMNEDTWRDVGVPMLLLTDGTAVFIFTPPSLRISGVSKAKDPRHASKMYDKFKDDTSGRWKTFHFTSHNNPLLSHKALQEITTDMSFDSYRREIMAEDDEIETSWLVYSKFNESLCKIKRFTMPTTWPIYSGHDFGSANPAALFIAKVKLPLPDGAPSYLRYGDYVAFREYAPGGGLSTIQHVEKFKELTKGYTVEQSVGGNITTEEEIRQFYTISGWTIVAPPITKVNTQIDRVTGLFELNKFYVFEDMPILLGQLANCMWKLDLDNKPTNVIKDEARWHLLACLRYLGAYLPAERIMSDKLVDKVKVKVW